MAHKFLSEINHIENRTSLIDCYRVALDFGLPAAQRVLEHLSLSSQQTGQIDKLINSKLKITS